ncbi:MAG: hypothetical protein HYX78_07040 [Armatimonadetes bacterium]|nr:hypothetical protein [Armatimonadota bacterium]
MKPKMPIHLRVLVDRQGSEYVAHCLEINLVSTGPTIDAVTSDMKDLIEAYIEYALENDNMDNFWRPAPPEVWQKLGEVEAKVNACHYSRITETMPQKRAPYRELEVDTFCHATV